MLIFVVHSKLLFCLDADQLLPKHPSPHGRLSAPPALSPSGCVLFLFYLVLSSCLKDEVVAKKIPEVLEDLLDLSIGLR